MKKRIHLLILKYYFKYYIISFEKDKILFFIIFKYYLFITVSNNKYNLIFKYKKLVNMQNNLFNIFESI